MQLNQISLSNTRQQGVTIIELVIVVALSSLLILGIVQIVSASSSSFRLQENQAEVLEHGRHAISLISRLIRQSGFTPQPWNPSLSLHDHMEGSTDQSFMESDRLVVRLWSDTNCFENLNPYIDGDGNPAFHFRESIFDLNSRKDLALTCRYGPDSSNLVTQINHQGLIRNVESFQLLFGEDMTGNGLVDHWVNADNWADPDGLLAVKVGLLFKSTQPVLELKSNTYQVLDRPYTSRADGRVRNLVVFTARIRGASG